MHNDDRGRTEFGVHAHPAGNQQSKIVRKNWYKGY